MSAIGDLRNIRLMTPQEFGSRHDWIVANKGFSLGQLGRISNHYRRWDDQYDSWVFNNLGQHNVFYRFPWRPYFPSAIALHIADWPNAGPEIEHLCWDYGLRYATLDGRLHPDAAGQLLILTPAKADIEILAA